MNIAGLVIAPYIMMPIMNIPNIMNGI